MKTHSSSYGSISMYQPSATGRTNRNPSLLSGFQEDCIEALRNCSYSPERKEHGGAPLKSIDSENETAALNPDNEVCSLVLVVFARLLFSLLLLCFVFAVEVISNS